MSLSLPHFGNGRRRNSNSRKKKGIYSGWQQDKLAELQAKRDALQLSHPTAKERLSKISLDSAQGFQAPRSEYELGDQLYDLYEFIVDMPEAALKTLLDELCTSDGTRRGTSQYSSLVRAGSAIGYNKPKSISLSARILRDARKAKVPLEQFEDFRKRYKN